MHRILLVAAAGIVSISGATLGKAEAPPEVNVAAPEINIAVDGIHVPRMWTDRSGKHRITATLIDSDRMSVRLQKSSGAQVTVPLDKLSSFDQHWVASVTAEDSLDSPGLIASVWSQLGLDRLPAQLTQLITPSSETGELIRDVQTNAIYIQVSESLLNRMVPQRHSYSEPIRDTILQAQVRGHGHTESLVRFDLVPNSTSAISDLLVTGRCNSRTTSYAGPIQVHGHSTTLFSTRTRITARDNRLVVLPTVSAARSRNITDSITSSLPRLRGRISLRIAEARVSEQHGQIEAISARHCEQRVNRKIDAALGQALAKMPESVRLAMSPGTSKLPLRLVSHSTDDRLHVSLLPNNRALCRRLPTPPQNDSTADLVVQIHSPLLNRALSRAEMKDFVRKALAQTAKSNVVRLVSTQANEQPHWTLRWSGDHRWVTFTWTDKPAQQRPVGDKIAAVPF